MAALLDLQTGLEHIITSPCLIGRNKQCYLHLPDDEKKISGFHACLEWNGFTWRLKDQGSRNGPWRKETRLKSGVWNMNDKDHKISLGKSTTRLQLTQAHAPQPFAESEDGTTVGAENEIHLKGNILIFYDQERDWLIKQNDQTRRAWDEMTVMDGARQIWKLRLPVLSHTIGAINVLQNIQLQFNATQGSKDVGLTIDDGKSQTFLGTHTFFFPLYILARLRKEDEYNGVPSERAGWTPKATFGNMVFNRFNIRYQYNDNYLNMCFNRIRTRLHQAGVSGGHDIIEQMDGSAQIRIGDVAKFSL